MTTFFDDLTTTTRLEGAAFDVSRESIRQFCRR